jgi:hypothetical protein
MARNARASTAQISLYLILSVLPSSVVDLSKG